MAVAAFYPIFHSSVTYKETLVSENCERSDKVVYKFVLMQFLLLCKVGDCLLPVPLLSDSIGAAHKRGDA